MSTEKERFPANLSGLIKLQEIDLKLLGLNKNINEMPAMLEETRAGVEQLNKKIAALQKKIEVEQHTKRQLELEINTQTDKIEKMKKRSSEIKTNKEYQAYMHEIESVKDLLSAVEDRALECMENISVAEKDKGAIALELAEKEQTLREKQTEIEGLIAKINTEVRTLSEEYTEVAGKIDKKLLDEYNLSKKKNRGIGLAVIRNSVCLGCYLSIMPQILAEIKRQDKFYKCPHCHRILYWVPEEIPEKPEKPLKKVKTAGKKNAG